MVYTIVVHLYAKGSPTDIEKLKNKLVEASQVYSKDRETVGWHVMQDHQDPRAFTIVERYERESSQKYHLENPYWKTFDPYVMPLLEKPMDLRRFNELDTSITASGDHGHEAPHPDPSVSHMYDGATEA